MVDSHHMPVCRAQHLHATDDPHERPHEPPHTPSVRNLLFVTYILLVSYLLEIVVREWLAQATSYGRSVSGSLVHQERSEERRVGKECRSRWRPACYNIR